MILQNCSIPVQVSSLQQLIRITFVVVLVGLMTLMSAAQGQAQSVRAPGSRKLAYRPETDLEKAVRGIVQTRKRREWDPMLASLREWIPRLAARGSGAEAVFRRRLEDIESVVGLTDSMAESFLSGSVLPRIGLKALVSAAARKKRKRR